MRAMWLRASVLCVTLVTLYTHLTPLAQAEERPEERPEEHPEKSSSERPSEPPPAAWRHAHMLAARANPPGLVLDNTLGYELKLRHLYGAEERHPLLGPTRGLIAGRALLTPQSAQLGPLLRATPLTVLELQLSALYALPSTGVARARRSQLSDAATLASINIDEGGADAIQTRGWLLSAQATLQLKVRRLAVRSAHQIRASLLRPEGSTGTFYDQNFDVITPFRSLLYQAETDAVYLSPDDAWLLGLRHTYTLPLAAGAGRVERLGPIFLWNITQERPGVGGKHSLVVLSQWHLQHSRRAGQEVSAWVPYFAVAYLMQGGL